MADRFPSLEDFAEDFAGDTEPRSNGATNGDIDGPDDFLAREKAILGDDADQFASSNDNAATVEDDGFDLLGGGDSAQEGGQQQQQGQEISEFESSFPAVDTQNNQMGPGGTITGSTLPYQPPKPSSYSGFAEPEEEPEPIR
ncbi:MAG: hypothetical protein Q9183_007485, partial [Haloplaca sp. 2 TL-2023]